MSSDGTISENKDGSKFSAITINTAGAREEQMRQVMAIYEAISLQASANFAASEALSVLAKSVVSQAVKVEVSNCHFDVDSNGSTGVFVGGDANVDS